MIEAPRKSAKTCQNLTKTSKRHDRVCCGIPVVKPTFMCRVDVSLIFKNVRRRKKVYNKSKSEEIPKDHFSAILEVSQVLSSSLTTLNQMFLTNNKRALSRFCGTVALTA